MVKKETEARRRAPRNWASAHAAQVARSFGVRELVKSMYSICFSTRSRNV